MADNLTDNGFIIDLPPDSPARVFVGAQNGTGIERQTGRQFTYCSIFLASNFPGTGDMTHIGYKAEKFSCLSPTVYAGHKPGDLVVPFFDEKKRVQMLADC